MNKSWTKYRAFLASPRPAGKTPAAALWDAVCSIYPDLSFANPNSIRTIDLSASVTARWVGRHEEAFMTCEVIDLERGESWQIFALPAKGGAPGSSRIGWSRRGGLSSDEPPKAWAVALEHLQLGAPIDAIKREPDFISLLATVCGDSAPLSVAYEDLDLRRELGTEVAYWKDTAIRQAELLRKSRAAIRPSRHTRSRQDNATAPETEPGSHAPPNEFEDFAWSDLQRWSDLHVDQIVIVPRAVAEAKKALYAEPAHALAALQMLATTYRDAKRGAIERQELKNHADRLGLSIGGSVDPSRAGEAGDEYFIRYGGRRRFLDQHVGRGTSRDPRFTLRIYFTWCDDTQRVVVGWLPTHLHTGNS